MQSLWMLVAAFLFALMATCVKLASARYGTAEIVMFRSLVGVLMLGAFVRLSGRSLATRFVGMHFRRGVVGAVALALWFFAISRLPMGTAMTLNFVSPLFTTAFALVAAFVVGRRLHWPLAGCVLAGFAGVVLILQPSFGAGQEVAALAGLLSGFVSAVAYWHVRQLGRIGEPEWRTVFYFSLCGALLGLAGMLVDGAAPRWSADGLALLVAVGVFATLAQLAMTRAYGKGRTTLAANLQFSAIVFAAIFGALVFADRIAPAAWLGIGVIVASCIVATLLATRLSEDPGAPLAPNSSTRQPAEPTA